MTLPPAQQLKAFVLKRLLDLFLELMREEASRSGPWGNGSKTLAESFEGRIVRPGELAEVTSPYYWARFVDQGRAAQQREVGVYLFFKDPREDPRTGGGANYPRTASERRKLTDFMTRAEIRERIREGSLIATQATRATTPANFVQRSMERLKQQQGPVIRAAVADYLGLAFPDKTVRVQIRL